MNQSTKLLLATALFSAVSFATSFSVRQNYCVYDRSIFNEANCSVNNIFESIETSSTGVSSNFDGSADLSFTPDDSTLRIEAGMAAMFGSADPGTVRAFTALSTLGNMQSSYVSSMHTIAGFEETFTVNSNDLAGQQGLALFGFKLTGNGIGNSQSAESAVVQSQLWHYLGLTSTFAWTLEDISGVDVDRNLFTVVPFTFGTAFNVSAFLTARVDSYCETSECAEGWSTFGISDIGSTLQINSLQILTANNVPVTSATINAGSSANANSFYNSIAGNPNAVPEPATVIPAVLLLAGFAFRKLRR
jgi:hypothetical protein